MFLFDIFSFLFLLRCVIFFVFLLCICLFFVVLYYFLFSFFFFFKQKTAYEMRISDWSSDVCSSDLSREPPCPCTVQALRSPRAPARPALSATAGLHESDASTRLLAHAKEERCSGRMSLLHLPIGPVPFVVANSGVAQQWVLSHGGRVQPPPRKAAA